MGANTQLLTVFSLGREAKERGGVCAAPGRQVEKPETVSEGLAPASQLFQLEAKHKSHSPQMSQSTVVILEAAEGRVTLSGPCRQQSLAADRWAVLSGGG